MAAAPLKSMTQYGGRYLVTLIPGDGIGKEMTNCVKAVFNHMKVPVDFDEVHLSGYDTADTSSKSYKVAVESLRRTKIGLKGTVFTPTEGHKSYNLALRKELDIFANIVPIKSVQGVPSRFTGIDFVIIRENTEGEYSGLEHCPVPGVVESMKITTKEKSERIVKFAFDYAIKHGRKKLTCVHKANIMKLTDGLFLRTFQEIAETYQGRGIRYDDMIVDNTAMQIVSNPTQFDILLTPNLYGTICANIGSGIIGGAGLVPGLNLGRDICLFEPGTRHAAIDLKDKNCANPTSILLSASWMLKHLSLKEDAEKLHQAILSACKDPAALTKDLKGSSTTTGFTDIIMSKL